MPELFAASLGKAVRAARQHAQLSQEQVAQVLALPPPAYRRLERGLLVPSVETLVRLAQLLRTSPSVLLGLSAPAPSQPPSLP